MDTAVTNMPEWASRALLALLVVLIAAMAVGPRIPLPLYLPNRTVDLRLEDLVITLACLVWAVSLIRAPRIYLTPLFVPFAIYLLVELLTTVIALRWQTDSIGRMVAYIAKDVEHFLLFAIVANSVVNERQVRRMSTLLIVLGLLNVGWATYQLAMKHPGPIVYLRVPSGGWENPSRGDNYGVSLIGEISPLAAGAYFALTAYVALGRAAFDDFRRYPGWRFNLLDADGQPLRSLSMSGRVARFAWIVVLFALPLLFSAASVAVGIKLSLVFASFGFLAFLFLSRRIRRMAVPIVAAMTGVGILFGVAAPFYVARVFFWGSYVGGFTQDRFFVWAGLIPAIEMHPFAGIGRGGWHFWANSLDGFGEAHNQYVRLLVEGGVPLLVTFLALLAMVAVMSLAAFLRTSRPTIRGIAAATFASVVALGIGSFSQDVFNSVLVSEFFWVLAGLTAAGFRMDASSPPPSSRVHDLQLTTPVH